MVALTCDSLSLTNPIYSSISFLSFAGLHLTYLANRVPKKKKVNGSEGAKYFSPVDVGTFFLVPMYYSRSSPSCPLVIGYVESFIFYLNFATPTPHYKSLQTMEKSIDLC